MSDPLLELIRRDSATNERRAVVPPAAAEAIFFGFLPSTGTDFSNGRVMNKSFAHPSTKNFSFHNRSLDIVGHGSSCVCSPAGNSSIGSPKRMDMVKWNI